MSDPSVFEILRNLITPYAADMTVKTATDTNYYLEETKSSDKPQMFAAVQVKKNYTSFHLFPVYTHPNLLKEVSPQLRKRMQGKSCFNFKTPDQIPTAELQSLVKSAHQSLG